MSRNASGRRLSALALVATVLLSACGGGMAGMDHGAGSDRSAPAGEGTSGTCAPDGTALILAADSSRFDATCLAAPAGQAFTIAFTNREPVAHNLAILSSHSNPEPLFRGELFEGPKTVSYQVAALDAGTYVFHCETHPDAMRGTFVVA